MMVELGRLHHAGVRPPDPPIRGPTTIDRFAAEGLKPAVGAGG